MYIIVFVDICHFNKQPTYLLTYLLNKNRCIREAQTNTDTLVLNDHNNLHKMVGVRFNT